MGKEIFVILQQAVSTCLDYIRNHPQQCFVAFCALMGVVGVCIFYVIQRTMYALKEQMRKKRAAKEKTRRNLQFTLPDKENTFIRERLQQALNNPNIEKRVQSQTIFVFFYAQKLLAQIGVKSLTTPDKLEVMEMQKLFNAYAEQPGWTVEEIRSVNDCFARVLKLCAKYDVELPS